MSKSWDPALCPVPSLLVAPLLGPQFLLVLLTSRQSLSWGLLPLASPSDEGHPLLPEEMALGPRPPESQPEDLPGPAVWAVGPRVWAGTAVWLQKAPSFLGAGSRDFFTWFLVHLLQAFTPVPQVASENCSDIPRVWCGPQLRAWCGPWPGPTLASALSLRSPSPGLPSWEAVSGPEQNLRSQSGQNWVRFPCCRQGGVSGARLSLTALGPEADALTVPSHRPLLAGEALWAWTVEVPAVWPAPLSSPVSLGLFYSSLRLHPLSVGRGLSHECC